MSQADFVTRGQALVTSGQYQEAVKVCRLGLLGRPTTVEGRVVLGQALFALGRYDEVLAEMRVALELDHTSVIAQLLKAEALLAKGDGAAATEVLARVQPILPADAERLTWLRGQVQRSTGRKPLTASHPAVGFVGGGSEPTNDGTKNYPNHGAEEEDTEPKDVDEAREVPTSVSTPNPLKRSNRQQAMAAHPGMMAPSAVLAVGDRSGTLEVDPEADGVEIDPDDDFGDIAQPPPGRTPAQFDGARGSVKRSSRRRGAPAPVRKKPSHEVSSVELDSDDLELIEDSVEVARPGPGTAVRNAVSMPAGPLETPPSYAPYGQDQPAPPLAQRISQQPHVMQVSPLPGPLPQRSVIAAAMPTAAAQPMPSPPAHMAATISPHANIPAMTAAQVQSAAAVDALFGGEVATPAGPPSGAPSWSNAGSHQIPGGGRAAPDEQTRQPGALDPRIARDSSASVSASASVETPSLDGVRTGRRRTRSTFALTMWILAGVLVIGGGVFAGFQIRAMRLEKQIGAAREQAVSLAKADTWQGWVGARDRVAGIARASSTIEHRAALARARGVLAYEFGDGVTEARAAVDKLGDRGGLDAAVAAAYVALAQVDPVAATAAAERAKALAGKDPTVTYLAGVAAHLSGQHKAAIATLRDAHDADPRPLYAVGLARAIAATGAWDDALAALDRALGAMPDHPAALIERALVLSHAGRIIPGPVTAEIRTQLVKLIDEGGRPLAEQPRGVSPAQVALANLALARVDFALRDAKAAMAALKAAADVRVDEPRFAAEAISTLFWFGELQRAKAASVAALAAWPGDRSIQLMQAEIALALGGPTEAINVLKRIPDAAGLPGGLALSGRAKLAIGDLAGARADLDAALKVLPLLDDAIVGRGWVALAEADVEYARKLVTPRYDDKQSNGPIITVYAAILHASGELESARQLLEKLVAGPASVDVARARLELGRVLRDLGDMSGARAALQAAVRANPTLESKLELALLLIEDHDPIGGRDTLNEILDKEPEAMANPRVVLEGARARMLAGDHAGAGQLLDLAEGLPATQRWVLDRERGRLALRKGDVVAAARSLSAALDGAGSDTETFLLAADLVTVDAKQTTELATKVKSLVETRLKAAAEALIVKGKLAIALGDYAQAAAAYEAAGKALGSTTPRRLAQAYYGLAVIAYNKQDDPMAKAQLDLVIEADPSIYSAYLFAATLRSTKDAAALELLRQAVAFNPDSVPGWYLVGVTAARLRKTKDLDQAIERLTAIAPTGPELAELRGLR